MHLPREAQGTQCRSGTLVCCGHTTPATEQCGEFLEPLLQICRGHTDTSQRQGSYAQCCPESHCRSSLPSCVLDVCSRSCTIRQFNRFRASQHISLEYRAAFPLSSPSSHAPCIPSTSNSMARQLAKGLRRSRRWHCRCSAALDHQAQDVRLKRGASRPRALRLVGSVVVVL